MTQKSNIPKYDDRNYWEQRYESEEHKEWLCNYDSICDYIRSSIKPVDKILVIGCGNSSFSYDLFKDGFVNIVNIDFASSVIRNMNEKYPKLTWIEMDMRHLKFESKSFNAVIEKATLDALMVGERDPWNPSEENQRNMDQVLKEITRVLTDDGVFISISFAQPHFRLPFYARREYGWSPRTHIVGQDFHYFVYLMNKGIPMDKNEIDKYLYARKNTESNTNNFVCIEEDNESVIYNISIN